MLYLGGLKRFGEKAWRKVQFILLSKLYPDFFVLFLIFSFNRKATTAFGKNYLNPKL